VLIGASKKVGVESPLPFVTLDHVRNDRRIQMPEVRQAVCVINGRCDVKGLHLQKDKV
jgi:hypothetical protein